MIRSGPNIYMISFNPHVCLKILDCSLFTRRVVVNEMYHHIFKYQLIRQLPATTVWTQLQVHLMFLQDRT